MIKIEKVTLKQGVKGEYKNLKLSDGRFVNMFAKDIDYSIAIDGAELDRDLVQNGDWLNLADKGEVVKEKATKEDCFNEQILKLNLIYEGIKQTQEHLGIDSIENKVENLRKETVAVDNTLPLDENGEIDPNLIPFKSNLAKL